MSTAPSPGTEKLLIFDPHQIVNDRIANLAIGWPNDVEVHRFEEFHDLANEVEQQGRHICLVAAITEDITDSLARIRIVHEEYPAIPVVLMLPLGFWLEPVELVRVGAIELVPDSVEDEQLDQALRRASRIGRAVLAPLVAEPDTRSTSVISFLSPNGGAGRTFMATNAATWLRRDGVERVCLIDLGGPYGSASTALRLRADFSVGQASRATQDFDELHEHLAEYMTTHELGFDLLASGDDPSDWQTLVPHEVGELIATLSEMYDAVVIDAPAAIDPIVEQIINHSTQLCVVGNLDVPALRALRLFLQQLDQYGIDPDQLNVVINRSGTGLGIEVGEALDYLDADVCGWIPAHSDVRRSMNLGRPMLDYRPKHGVSRNLDQAFAGLASRTTSGFEVTDVIEETTNGDRRNSAKWFIPKLSRVK